jgi:hypothetical protein
MQWLALRRKTIRLEASLKSVTEVRREYLRIEIILVIALSVKQSLLSVVIIVSCKAHLVIYVVVVTVRECAQNFQDWPRRATTANGTALCH